MTDTILICRPSRLLAGLLIILAAVSLDAATAQCQRLAEAQPASARAADPLPAPDPTDGGGRHLALYELTDLALESVVLYRDRYTYVLASRDEGMRWKVEAIVASTGYGENTRVDEILDARNLPQMLAGIPDSFPVRYLVDALKSGALPRTRNVVVEEALRSGGIVKAGARIEPLHDVLDTIDLNQLVVFRVSGEASDRLTAERKRQDEKFIAALATLQSRMHKQMPEMTETMRYYTRAGSSRGKGPLVQLIEDEALDTHDIALCDTMYAVASYWGRVMADGGAGHFVILSWSGEQIHLTGLAIIERYGDNVRATMRSMRTDVDAEAYLRRIALDAPLREYVETVNSGGGAFGIKPSEIGLSIQPEFINAPVLATFLQRDQKMGEGEEEGGGGE